VTVTAALTKLTISPTNAALTTGATQQFTVSGTWSDGSNTTPSVTYSATGGTITAAGLYTAPSATAGTFTVTATQQGGTLTASATVTVSATLKTIPVSPASVAMSTGATQQFTASGTSSDNTTTAPAVTWTATG